MAMGLRSIGQVMTLLKPEHPDLSISKIRYLEQEGLLTPERAPSGYRRYAETDIERLRYILELQQQHYLPLRVIREYLDELDHGGTPVVPGPSAEDEEPAMPPGIVPHPAPPKRAIRVTRRELLRLSGLSEATLRDLERQGLVTPRRGTAYYGRDALTIAVIARKLAEYGMDARHLRIVKQAAEREVGLVEQALAPHLRRTPSARDAPAEVMRLVMNVHAAIMRSTMAQ